MEKKEDREACKTGLKEEGEIVGEQNEGECAVLWHV